MDSAQKSTFEKELIRSGKLIYTNVGDSMMPLLRQGRDVMVIERPKDWNMMETGEDTAKKLKRLDVPLYRRDNGNYVLHRIIKVRKKDYVICGDNRYQREYGISDLHIIGVLTGVIRDGREISVHSRKYLFYVHLWCDFFWVRAGILWLKEHLKKKTRRKKQGGV